MSQYTELYVGIDVAKRTLEVALSSGESWTVSNEAAGIAKLVAELVRRKPALVVMEASGGYERGVWLALLAAEIPTARVNPRDTHHFAQANRQLAKTDRLDARGLTLFAAQIRPRPDVAPSAADERLQELVGRRQQLVGMLTAEHNREQQAISPANRRGIRTVIRFLERQCKAIERAIEEHLSKHAQYREVNEILQSAKGVGPGGFGHRYCADAGVGHGLVAANSPRWSGWPLMTAKAEIGMAAAISLVAGPTSVAHSTWLPCRRYVVTLPCAPFIGVCSTGARRRK